MVWVQNVFGQTPYTLTGNEDWGTMPGGMPPPSAAAYGVIIGGHELKIEGITLTLNSGKSITVGTGGLLDIKDASIESSSPNTWLGITATGSSGQEQFVNPSGFPTDDLNNEVTWKGLLNGSQTQVIFQNVEINRAKIGVKSLNGAVVRTRGGKFFNCEKGVVIEPFISISRPELNACFFMGTDFTWNSIPGGFNSSDFVAITLNKVRGVNIGGCDFLNEDTDPYCNLTRGIGVKGIEADFGISTDGDELCDDGIGCTKNCFDNTNGGSISTFEGLTTGVVTDGHSSNKSDRIGIRDCLFTDLLNSIDIEFSKHSVIFQSNFTAHRTIFNNQYISKSDDPNCDGNTELVGNFISISESGATRIVENNFTFDNSNFEFLRMYATGTNGNSLIRKNEIHNINSGIDGADEVIGILSQGNNSKLDIECNDFDNLSNDIYIADGSNLKNIKDINGKCNNNRWSSTIGNVRLNIFNDGANITIRVQNGSLMPTRGGTNSSGVFRELTNNVISCDSLDDCNILTDETGVGIIKIVHNLVKIYPNPTGSILNIELLKNVKNYPRITIYDVSGKVIVNKDLSESLQFDISDVSDGLLFIKVLSDKTTYNLKVMKITN